MNLRSRCLIAMALMGVASVAGCASLRKLATNADDLNAKQEQRGAEAVRAFESQRDWAQLEGAKARWREGNLLACREALTQMLERRPEHLEARLLLAQVLLSEEKFEQALQELDRADAKHPDHAELHYLRGLALDGKGEHALALTSYHRAAELEPLNEQYESAHETTADRNSPTADEAATDGGYYAGSAKSNDAFPPDSPEVAAHFAEAEQTLVAGDTARACACLNRAIISQGESPNGTVRAAMFALRHNRPEMAISLLEPRATRFSDSPVVMRVLGTAYYRAGAFRQAQSALEQALSLDNHSALAYVLMGCTLEKLGQQQAADSHFAEAHRLDPRL